MLRAIEAGLVPPTVRVDQPVLTMRAVSHDPTCRRLLTLVDGRTLTAMDLQEVYLEAARDCYELMAGELTEPARIEAKDVFTRWQEVLDTLRRDPTELADQLDWVAKLQLMDSYRERDGLGCEPVIIAANDTSSNLPSRELVRRFLPGVREFKSELPERTALISNRRAQQLLGWKQRYFL